MRSIGLVLMVLGFALVPASCFYMFGSTFASTGRSVVDREETTLDGALHERTFAVEAGKKYLVAISLQIARSGVPSDEAKRTLALTYDLPAHVIVKDAKTGDVVLDEQASVAHGEHGVIEYGTSTEVMGDAIVERTFSWFVAPSSGAVKVQASIGPAKPGGTRVSSAAIVLYNDVVRSARKGIAGVIGALVMFVVGVALFIGGHARSRARR